MHRKLALLSPTLFSAPDGGGGSAPAGEGTPPTNPTTVVNYIPPPADNDEGDGEPVDWQARFTAQREETRKQETRAKSNAEAAKELARLKAGSASETEKAIAAAVEAATKSTATQYQSQLLELSIEAAAGGSFTNTDDAVTHLGSRSAEFLDDEGKVDKAAVKKAVNQLLKDRPYLAAKQEEVPPSFDGGQRGGTTGATNMDTLIRRSAGVIR